MVIGVGWWRRPEQTYTPHEPSKNTYSTKTHSHPPSASLTPLPQSCADLSSQLWAKQSHPKYFSRIPTHNQEICPALFRCRFFVAVVFIFLQWPMRSSLVFYSSSVCRGRPSTRRRYISWHLWGIQLSVSTNVLHTKMDISSSYSPPMLSPSEYLPVSYTHF